MSIVGAVHNDMANLHSNLMSELLKTSLAAQTVANLLPTILPWKMNQGCLKKMLLEKGDGAYNSTIKPLMLHFVWRIKVNVALPHCFQLANILFCMATAPSVVGVVGIVGMTPLQTPKDFANSCHQCTCSAAPIHAIQSEDITSTPPVATTAALMSANWTLMMISLLQFVPWLLPIHAPATSVAPFFT